MGKSERIQVGLRVPEHVREKLIKKSEETGCSMNDTVLMMIDIGLTVSSRGYVIPSTKE